MGLINFYARVVLFADANIMSTIVCVASYHRIGRLRSIFYRVTFFYGQINVFNRRLGCLGSWKSIHRKKYFVLDVSGSIILYLPLWLPHIEVPKSSLKKLQVGRIYCLRGDLIIQLPLRRPGHFDHPHIP